MKLISTIFISFLVGTTSLWAGEDEKPSSEVIEAGVKLYDEGKYEEALAKFLTVSRNDSNYVYCLDEIALTHFALKNYDKAIEICNEGLKHKSEYDHHFYEIIAGCYDDKGELDKAMETYDKAIELFPFAFKLHFEKGVALLKAKKYPEAEKCFMKSAQMNPFHASSHLYLGHTYRLNGYVVPAVYAYMMFLIAEPASERSLGILITIENISQGKELPSPDSIMDLKIDKEAYSEAELIMQSGVARDKKYKLKSKADYTATRQMQCLFEKVEYAKSNPDFWMQYYVPFFNKVNNNNYFETFTYDILQSVKGNEKLTKVINSSTGDIDKFAKWVGEEFHDMRDKYFATISKKDNIRYVFYNSGMAQASGEYNESKKAFVGDFEYYYPAGYVSHKGKLDEAGKKQGVWNYYFTAARPKSTYTFKDDVGDGEYTLYHENGKVKEKGINKAGETDGDLVTYYATGEKHFEGSYKLNIRQGIAKVYFKNGRLKEEAEYKDGKLNGINRTYYDSGELADDITNKNDLAEGAYKKYHRNGNKAVEGQFLAGMREGNWTWYHENGKVAKTLTYKADKENGKLLSYYEDGTKEEETDYANGKLNGKEISYDEDGVVYYEATYTNDKITSYKFLNKKGDVVAQSTDIKNEQVMKVYFPAGELKAEGKITNKTKIGSWKYYDVHGNVLTEEKYNNKGQVDGIKKNYYKGGMIKEETSFKDGEFDGYFKKYYMNGKVSDDGRYDKDVEQGTWKTYYINGAVEREMYFLDGALSGYDVSYAPNNKKESEDFFEYGYYNATNTFDTTGQVIHESKLDCGTGKMALSYLNKKPKLEASMKNGKYDGPFKRFYPNGKLSMEFKYDQGDIVGLRKDYSYNGNLLFEGYYKNGDLDSISKNYDDDGKLSYTARLKNGENEGEAVWYYPNGQKEITVNYKSDKRHGDYQYYAPDGTLMFRFKYLYGEIRSYSYMDKTGKMVDEIAFPKGTATLKMYYATGSVSAEINYDKGSRHGKLTYFYPNGKVMEEAEYFYGEINGVNKTYYETGTLKSEIPQYYGEKQGVEKEYNSAGKLLKETTYDAGIRNGDQKIYDAKTGKLIKTINYVYGDPYE